MENWPLLMKRSECIVFDNYNKIINVYFVLWRISSLNAGSAEKTVADFDIGYPRVTVAAKSKYQVWLHRL
jgi:hypothetical protein